MFGHKFFNVLLLLAFIVSPLFGGSVALRAQTTQPITIDTTTQSQGSVWGDDIGQGNTTGQMRTTTQAMRMAAAAHQNLQRSGSAQIFAGINPDTASMSPLAATQIENLAQMSPALNPPDYFGVANWANSPLPQLDLAGNVIPGTGIRKFIDALPGLCPFGTNSLGQCIPVGVPDTLTFPGSDYYEIAVVEYLEQMSPDLPAPGTKLRGYVQVVPSTFPGAVALTVANGLTMDILDRSGNQVYGATRPHYLGPLILAQGCSLLANPSTCTPIPVRVKFTNYLPTGPGGDLFIPVDTTYMGAGMGPGGSIYSVSVTNGGTGYTSAPSVVFTGGGATTDAIATATVINGAVTSVQVTLGGAGYTAAPAVSFSGGGGTGATATAVLAGQPGEMYTQNRATLHLHGGNTPWISDGTTHQWTTPFGELTSYSKGDSAAYVPDMWFDSLGNLNPACAGQLTCPGYSNDPGLGSLTFYWTNQQSGRLLFFHDHSYGITRLNVYGGEAAGYLIVDPTEEAALAAAGAPGTVPNDLSHLIPLVIQDKTFVPDDGTPGGQLALTDPTWDVALYGGKGNLWFPHVYMPNQNPADVTGANAFGRWDYGPWFWPPQDPSGFVGQPYQCTSAAYPPGSPPAFPPLMCPGIPNPSGTPEGFMDTPVINGALYPTLTVDPTSYRFQMLMAGNDRTWNLQLYVADPLSVAVTNGGSNYTLPPIVGFTGGGGGSGATATAHMSNGSVTSILITGVGHGYTVPPNVHITGNGTGAAATAVVDPVTTTITAIRITSGGSGYTSATVTIDPPAGCLTGCVTATAQAFVTPPGSVLGITVTNPGSGWTSAPTVTFTNAPGDTTGSGAAAIASINTEVKMVPADPHDPSSPLPLCADATQTSGAMLALAFLDVNGNPLNGTGLPAGCWPTSWPTDGRDGGVPDPLTAGPPFIQIGSESGLLPAPVVIPSTPVNYEYNRRSITVLNIWTHGLLLGPAERADVIVDFSQFAGKTLLLYNDAPAPVPAFDSRTDYYTGDPDQTITGGAPSTLPGYGPNTRTIMQIKVNAVAGGGNGSLGSITVTNPGAGYTAPTVAISGGGGSGATATAMGSVDSVILTNAGSGYVNPTVSFSGGGGSGASAIFTSGAVSGLTLTANGAAYASVPTISFTGGGGSLAAALAFGSVDAIQLTAGGGGYANTNVSFTGGGGSGATASATGAVDAIAVTTQGAGYVLPVVSMPGGATGVASGAVDNLILANGGTGYTAPVVSITGGGGTGATATATVVGGVITGLTLTNPGSGYTSAPAVAITDVGPGTGATATASQTGGIIDTVIPGAPGTGYLNPLVTVTDSGGPGSGAIITAQIDAFGAITGYTIVNGGSGYVSPVLTITDAGLGTGASATSTISITAIAVTAPGSGYTAAPVVSIIDGGGTPVTPAAATATLTITTLTLGLGGSGYTSAPTVSFTGGGAGATATDTLKVSSLTLTSPGSGYTSAPTVVFTGGGGSGAAATASISATGIQLISGGFGYTSAPLVIISDTGGGTGATAVATINVNSVTLTNPGTGYTSIPVVTIADSGGGTGTGATAIANMASGVPINLPLLGTTVTNLFATQQAQMIVPEPGFPAGNGGTTQPTYSRISDTSFTGWFNGHIGSITLTSGGSGYSSAPSVSFTGGGGTGASASLTFIGATVNTLTLTARGSGYTSAPTVSFTGGGGTGATASAIITRIIDTVTVTRGGTGYTSPPAVSFQGGGGTGATAIATIAGGSVTAITVTNGGSGYTSVPNVRFTGGGGNGARATANLTGVVAGLLLTNGGTGYSSNPTVSFTGGGGSGAAATATYLPGTVASLIMTNAGTGYTSAPTIVFTGGGTPTAPATAVANPPLIGFGSKAIQELFTLDYGRMNATLGVEIPFTNFFIQTTIPYGYVDPPTELLQDGEVQFWKITHNGVDTHFIHFHLYDVQVINRVGWDGAIKPPDVNEMAWKDTVRMNPLEDIIVALRPMKQQLPWELPNSQRPMDVTEAIGASNPNNTQGFANIDPTNQPAPVTNDVINFGWEYVVHCHILGHEENDMMRAQALAVKPDAPTNVNAIVQGSGNSQSVLVTWTDQSINETEFAVQRSISQNGPWLTLTPTAPAAPGRGTAMSYVDTTVARRTVYYYRVVAQNVVGYTQTYAPPSVGYPTLTAESAPVDAPAPVQINRPEDEGPIFADSFETGLNQWSGVIGSNDVITPAVIGPNGGALGMVSTIGPDQQAAYVYDTSPIAETMYDANFYFNPNTAVANNPVDVFLGLDQNGQPIFGVQYQTVDSNTFQLRAWVLNNGIPQYTRWDVFRTEPGEDEPVVTTHKLDVAWTSGVRAGFSFYVDDHLFASLIGDTSAYQLEEVVLGPTLGLDGASGSMFFDEFTSSAVIGQSYNLLLPVVSR